MKEIIQLQKEIIKTNHLFNWFKEYPWLNGFIGNLDSPVWLLGENPSLTQMKKQLKNKQFDENLQWNASAGDNLLRESLTESGLKEGNPDLNEGWNCYITNVIKEPEVVVERNQKKHDSQYWKKQAKHWLPVLQMQIDMGNPKVLVCLGGQSEKILNYMVKIGLKTPNLEKIHHYSYIMLRPESGTRRGPRHPERIKEFKISVKTIAKKYNTWDNFFLSDTQTSEDFLSERVKQ